MKKSNQNGASMILWTVALIPMLGLAALAVDVNNMFLASSELQNAADAGALEGARNLYNSNGTIIQKSIAESSAKAAANSNTSVGTAAEIFEVAIGHWHFDPSGSGTFTPYIGENPVPIKIFGKVFDSSTGCNNLNNACSGEINAVKVTTERKNTLIDSFFGIFLGKKNYAAKASAVAYVGYAGSLSPNIADTPIAICKESIEIKNDGSLQCRVATLYNTPTQTAGWTSFLQDDDDYNSCPGNAKKKDLNLTVCSNMNLKSIKFGYATSTKGGTDTDFFKNVYDCWKTKTSKEKPWEVILPVIECKDETGKSKNPGPCDKIVGAVKTNIMYIVDQNDKIKNDAPKIMKDKNGITLWTAPPPTTEAPQGSDKYGEICWDSFVNKFGILGIYNDAQGNPKLALSDSNNSLHGWQNHSVYLDPNCEAIKPSGTTDGRNFGVRSIIPVLVH